MSESTSAQEVIVPVKVPEPEDHAPPSLAEPASGPVAEMSGALQKDTSTGAATDAKPADPVTAVNGEPESAAPEVPKPSVAEPLAPASAVAVDEKTSEQTPAEQDTQMKDVEPAQPTETVAAVLGTTSAANGTPSSKAKRKSTGGVPEHKSKTLKKKQSKAKLTNLDANPGDYYLARLRSYPPWPSIVCDESMLPDILLKTRPGTAMQSDGTYKEAYTDGGSKVTDRTYAIMFLHTNEFGWIANTDLTPLEPESCKDFAEKGKTKQLIEAYKVAAENHDLDHFKNLLMEHDKAIQEDEAQRQQLAAEKAAKKKRKSEVKVDADVDMEDADPAPKKASKKRKKEAGSDDEETEKPVKTPKINKLKLTTGKTPTTDKKTKDKPAKPKADKKKKAAEESDEEVEVEKEAPLPVDPVQARKDREKEVLFLRHKLQKGFLSRDQEPSEEEMPQMANYIKKLEAYGDDIDVHIIRNTKINKVLKGIIKLNTIPKDEEYHFKERSIALLAKWNQLLGTEPLEAEKSGEEKKASPTTTNGVQDAAEDKMESKIAPSVEQSTEDTLPATTSADKVSAEVAADVADTAAVIDAPVKNEKAEVEVKPESVPVTAPAPTATEDKAPESAAAAAEVAAVVKASE